MAGRGFGGQMCLLVGVLWAVVLGWSPQAAAENQDPFFLSNEAALTAGAVTAVSGDSGAPWYNPAGLVTIERSSINISSSAFVLRWRDAQDVLRLELPGGTTDEASLRSFELLSVPSSIVVTRRLTSDLKMGLGIFVPQQDHYTVSAELNNEDGQGQGSFRQRLKLTEELTRYHAGPSLGWQAAEGLRVGASLFVVYEQSALEEEFLAGFTASEANSGFVFNRRRITLSGIGAQGVAGVQWSPVSSLTLGLTLRSPVFIFQSFGQRERLTNRTRVNNNQRPDLDVDFQEDDFDELDVRQAYPLRAHLGVAWRFEGGHVAVEGDFRPAFKDQEREIDSGPIVNLRAGTHFEWTQGLSVGLGAFTDLSGEDEPDELWETQVDFYGGTAGMTFSTAHLLADGSESDDLVFSTTLALRYAVGVGRVGGQLFRPLASGGETSVPNVVDVVFHELGVHLGSAVYF